MNKQILKVILAVAVLSTAALANATSILKPEKSVFKVEASQADKVYVKLVKDRVEMDSCNNVAVAVVDVKDVTITKVIERVIPVPVRDMECRPVLDINGNPVHRGGCERNLPIYTPKTELVEVVEKTGVDIEAYVTTTEIHCPVEPYLATAISNEIELDVTPGKPFTITAPGSIDRVELSLRPTN